MQYKPRFMKTLCLFAALLLAFGTRAEAAVTDADLAGPVRKAETHIYRGKHETAFHYVYFGSYPQREVPKEEVTDAIKNAGYDQYGDAVVDGRKYRRLTWEMKTTTGTIHTHSRTQWDSLSTDGYRYFVYEPIRWRILENRDGTLFLMADEGLDLQWMDGLYSWGESWETLDLRTWLNYDGTVEWTLGERYKTKGFLVTAFDRAQQEKIQESRLKPDVNPYNGLTAGKETTDKVFVMSFSELTSPDYGFCCSKMGCDYYYDCPPREVEDTEYVFALGFRETIEHPQNPEWKQSSCGRWTRTPGESYAEPVLWVYDSLRVDAWNPVTSDQGVVPALRVDGKASDCIRVSFDTFGAGNVESQVLLGSQAAKEPEKPERPGYALTGWYTDKECTKEYNFGTALTGDTTLYAGWKPYIKIQFEANGGSAAAEQTIVSGTVPEKPADPKREGYVFTGWYTDAACRNAYTFTEELTGNSTLYAGWKPYIEIRFEVNGGSVVAGQTIVSGTVPEKPADPKKAGYVFTGWYTDAACRNAYTFTEELTGNSTLYAGWRKEEEQKQNDRIMEMLDVPEDTAEDIRKYVEKNGISQAVSAITEQDILGRKDDKDIPGSSITAIQARADKVANKTIRLRWNVVKGADGYCIYGNKCGTKNKYRLITTITKGKTKTYTQKKLKKGTYYKYIVRAYKEIGGKKVTIAVSKTVHATTSGGKNGNAKSVRVKKASLSLKKGKTYSLNGKEVKQSKPIKTHRKVAYETTNPKVATVNSKGVVRAAGKGSCTVYAYAQNGVFKKIKVKVK